MAAAAYKFHGALYALAANHDGSNVVVAGRNVLTVLAVAGDRATEAVNLMAGKKPEGSLYYSNDVKWCKTQGTPAHQAAARSTRGA